MILANFGVLFLNTKSVLLHHICILIHKISPTYQIFKNIACSTYIKCFYLSSNNAFDFTTFNELCSAEAEMIAMLEAVELCLQA